MTLVYLDTETSGLDPVDHEMWEIAWAVEDGPIHTMHKPLLRLHRADQDALAINGYFERQDPKKYPWKTHDLRNTLDGATIVGANPAFDTAFLREYLDGPVWHHRLIDVEAMAYALLRTDRPEGLNKIAGRLLALGYTIPDPNHTAAGDVACVRAVHNALRDYRRRM